MSKRMDMAIKVLAEGGYFRKQLETHYHGGEKFKVRLRSKNGDVVEGIGGATLYALIDAGKLKKRPCERSSVWPEEWEAA